MATIEELKTKYANQYGNIAAAMQTTKDDTTYNELKTLRDYKLNTLNQSTNQADKNEYNKWSGKTVQTDPNANFTVDQYGNAVSNTPSVQVPESETDKLIKAFLTQQLGKPQQSADFNSYISNWKPDMSQQQYVDNVTNAATAAQNTVYDNTTSSIKQRLANILTQYNGQLAGLPNQYKPLYEANTQNAYNQDQSVKQTMARLGLLNSGVDVGNQKQTQNTYNAARQDIDLDKQGAINDINTEIGKATSDSEYELTNAERIRQNAIAQAKAEGGKEYMDYMQKQKEFAASNFWNGADYNINAQKVQNDLLSMAGNYSQGQQKLEMDAQKINVDMKQRATEFAQTMGFESEKLSQQDKQYYDGLAQEQKQYEDTSSRQASQFAAQMGFDREKLLEDGRQFDAQLGFSREQLSAEISMNSARLTNSLATARIRSGINEDGGMSEKLKEEKRQFDESMKLEIRGMDLKHQEMYNGENDRLDNVLATLFDKYQRAQVDEIPDEQTRLATQIVGSIRSSSLPDSFKLEKFKMIEEITGIDVYQNVPDGIRGHTRY